MIKDPPFPIPPLPGRHDGVDSVFSGADWAIKNPEKICRQQTECLLWFSCLGNVDHCEREILIQRCHDAVLNSKNSEHGSGDEPVKHLPRPPPKWAAENMERWPDMEITFVTSQKQAEQMGGRKLTPQQLEKIREYFEKELGVKPLFNPVAWLGRNAVPLLVFLLGAFLMSIFIAVIERLP